MQPQSCLVSCISRCCWWRRARREGRTRADAPGSEQVASPEEPLALRLSSNLLCGIARVYQQQVSSRPRWESSPSGS